MKNKGSAIYFSLIILAVILGMVLGLSAMLVSQIKVVRGMGDSVVALYAANSGIEKGLYLLRVQTPSSFPHNATSTINLNGSTANYKLIIDSGLLMPGGATGGCVKNYFCIRSEGDYRGIKRAIEVGN